MPGLEGEFMDNGHSLWVITDMISEGESVLCRHDGTSHLQMGTCSAQTCYVFNP